MSGLFVIQVYNEKKKEWVWLKGGTTAQNESKNLTPSQKYSFLGELEPFNTLTLAIERLNYHLGFSDSGYESLMTKHGFRVKSIDYFKENLKHRIINIIDNCNVVLEITLNQTPYHYMNSIGFSEHVADLNGVCFDSKYGEELFKFTCKNTQSESYLGCSQRLEVYKDKIEKFYKELTEINVLDKY